jgi:hypothetical protein
MTTPANLANVFSDKAFFIPDYQRGYSWEQKEWNDLVEDLELLPPKKTHYAGTLVVKPMTDHASDFIDAQGNQNKHFEVIDGQQRLTTVVILLKVIEGELERQGLTELVSGLRSQYLMIRDVNGTVHYRLNLSDDSSKEFFSKQILGDTGAVVPTVRSHQLLMQAWQYFDKYLKNKHAELGEDDYSTWLREFYFKIIHGFTFIEYQVESEMDAGVIFETMNDRGRELTELEKVKNYFLYLTSKIPQASPQELRNKINTTWKKINEHLMLSGLATVSHEESLLRVHWLMAFNTDEDKWDKYRSIKERFNLKKYLNSPVELANKLIEYLDVMEKVTNAYCDIYGPLSPNAFGEFAPEYRIPIREVSEQLRRLGIRSPFIPLLIAVRLRMSSDPEAYYRVAELSEKIIFRVYALAGSRSNWGKGHLYHLAYNLYTKNNTQLENLLNEMTRLVDWYCPDKRLEDIFKSETYNWYAMGKIGYLLFEYDRSLAKAANHPQVEWDYLFGDAKRQTIEHILPQDASHPYWKAKFDEERHRRWVNDIGNLTLTFDNSNLSNKAFPDKRGVAGTMNCYASSKLFVEQELAQSEDWTEGQIIQRRERILIWAKPRWYVPPYQTNVYQTTETTSAEERLIQGAETNGFREEFCLILDTIRKFPVYLRMQRNWWGVSVTPRDDKRISLFWFGPDLYWFQDRDLIERHLKIPAAQIDEIMGNEKHRYLKPEEVDDLVTRLYQLLDRIQASSK